MRERGFIKVHRKIKDHEVFANAWLCKLWLWCMIEANHKPRKYRGQLIERGQFITGRKTGASELGVTESKFYRGLKTLEKWKCLVLKSNRSWTLVTVCKYSTYQDKGDKQRTTNEQQTNSERTASEQQSNTTNEWKNPRREEVNTFSLSSDSESKKIPEPPRATQQANAGLMPIPDQLNQEPFTTYWYQSWLPSLRAKARHG